MPDPTDHPNLIPNTGEIGPLIDLERLDDNLFRNRVNDININGALFGGQVLSQALAAAIATVDDRPVHSLLGYFVRRGDGARPAVYQVERTRDGASFSTRRITAFQHGVPIFHMEASFHGGDPGFDHQVAPELDAPDPDNLMNLSQLAEAWSDRLLEPMQRRMRSFRTLEIRPTDPERQLLKRSTVAKNSFWVRLPSAGSLQGQAHACALAYASDSWLAAATRMIHAAPGDFRGMQLASLDHAMWFHAPVRADEWNLYETDSPWTGAGRGLARGTIFNRDGKLVCSVAQEVLMRRTKDGL